MTQYAVIVAGGSGSRMGGGIPKQFRTLCRRPVLWWSMKAFHDENPATVLILVLPRDFVSLWKDFYSGLPEVDRFPFKVAIGGESRTESVKHGLDLIDDEHSLVAIHDGARPMVSPDVIRLGWATALDYGAGVPVVPVIDSLRLINKNNGSEAVNRDDYVVVQTPQVFKTSVIKDAYRRAGLKTFSDDATAAEAAGSFISLFKGDPKNIKVTNPKDLDIAELLMGSDG